MFISRALKTVIPVIIFGTFMASHALARTISETFPSSPDSTLSLNTQTGSVAVSTHNSTDVIVRVSITDSNEDDFAVTFDNSDERLEIRGQKALTSGWNRLKVKYEITVPDHYDLVIDTSGGAIEIRDLTGEIDAKTSGGSILVDNITGDITLHTSGGSIKTKDIEGEINAHTSGGSITVTFATPPTKDARLTTSGGSVTAKLPASAQIDLEASTSGGRVSSDFNINGRVKTQSIDGKINGGGSKLELHTSGGSVYVEKI